jgi:hypothetical protein
MDKRKDEGNGGKVEKRWENIQESVWSYDEYWEQVQGT